MRYKYTDVFELIDKGENCPLAAVFMTYGFEARIFENHMLPAFLGVASERRDNEARFKYEMSERLLEIPVAVISSGSSYRGGRTLMYDHIAINDVTFHPKCFLLLYKEFLRVIIGSGNITKSGICYNAELVWHMDITPGDNLKLGNNIHRILEAMIEKFGLSDVEAIKSMRDYTAQFKGGEGFPQIISTMDEMSPLETLIAHITEEVKSVTILSPFFESDGGKISKSSLIMSFVNDIHKKSKNASFKIYFPGSLDEQRDVYKVDVPKDIFSKLRECEGTNVEYFVVSPKWETDTKDEVVRNVHAKLVMIEFENGNRLYLCGSMNFTKSAMNSKKRSLKNFEIGVLEYSKKKLVIPNCKKVQLSQLEIQERPSPGVKRVFLKEVRLDMFEGKYRLILELDEKKTEYPFDIFYSGELLETVTEKRKKIVFEDFKLKQELDIKIQCNEDTCYCPIFVADKKIMTAWPPNQPDIEIGISDIIDFNANRYRSIREIIASKKVSGGNSDKSSMKIMTFRQNLNRFFKALAAMKKGLESPFYTDYAFSNHINNPLGIARLVDIIVGDYKEYKNKYDGIKQESFFFLVEILNMLTKLNFEKDFISDSVKHGKLKDVKKKSAEVLNEIMNLAEGRVKKQYEIIVKNYGLEGDIHE